MTRQAALTILGCAILLLPAMARSEEPSECLRNFEKGQVLRKDKHLLDAKKAFIRCAKEDCAGALAAMCEKFLDEVESRIPSVLIGVSVDGEDTREAHAEMDGVPLQIDVHELEVEPGFHSFTVTVPGMAPVERKVAVREGEKLKAIQIALTRHPAAQEAAPKPAAGGNVEPPAGTAPHRAPNLGPWIVMGAGGVALAVATGFGVAAINQHGTACPNGGSVCDADAYDHGLKLADTSTALFVVGGAAVAGGLVWFLLDRPKGNTRPTTGGWIAPQHASLHPYVGLGSLGLRGEFE